MDGSIRKCDRLGWLGAPRDAGKVGKAALRNCGGSTSLPHFMRTSAYRNTCNCHRKSYFFSLQTILLTYCASDGQALDYNRERGITSAA